MTDIDLTSDITAELIQHTGSDEMIARAAWVSTQGANVAPDGEEINEERLRGLLGFLMKNRHGSPFEHNTITMRVSAPISVFREWHRHRAGFSYNEASGRYMKLAPVFYVPDPNRPLKQVGKAGAYEFVPIDDDDAYWEGALVMHEAYESAYASYERLLEMGWAKEVARQVLPVGLFSTMYVTANLRAWFHFLSLRCNVPDATFPSKPMHEIEMPARQALEILRELFPISVELYEQNGWVAP